MCVCVHMCTCALSRVKLFVTPWTVAQQVPLPMGFSRQDYWSQLPFPSPGDLPNPGIKTMSPVAPAQAGRFFTTEPRGKPRRFLRITKKHLRVDEGSSWVLQVLPVTRSSQHTHSQPFMPRHTGHPQTTPHPLDTPPSAHPHHRAGYDLSLPVCKWECGRGDGEECLLLRLVSHARARHQVSTAE